MLLALCFNPLVLLTVTVLVAILFVRSMRNTYSQLAKLKIPGPTPVWVFGNALDFRDKNPLDVFTDWKKTYGSVYGFYEGFRAGLVVNDPGMAHEILSKQFDKFHTRATYRPFQYYPDNLNLVSIAGEHWKGQRYIVNKTLNVAASMIEVMENIQTSSSGLVDRLEKQRRLSPDGFNINEFVFRYASNTMMSVLLNMDDEDMRRYGEVIYEYTKVSNRSASADNQITGLARLFPSLTPFLALFDRDHKQSHDKTVNILRQYLAANFPKQNEYMDADKHSSLLTHMSTCRILSRDIDGSLVRRRLTEDEMLAHVLSLLAETYQTTASAILFVLYELALHQELQDELYDEVCELCGAEEDDLNAATLQSMRYFDMFFNETLRVHPLAPGVQRVCSESCSINGVNFVSGMSVRVMTCTMYNDHTLFPDPDKFDPQRFSEKERSTRDIFSFMPFGQGPRICPGSKLAILEVKAAVVNILRKYRIQTTTHTEIPIKTALRPSLTPANGVHVTFTPRKSGC